MPALIRGPAAIRGIVFDKDGTLFDFSATWTTWTERLLRELAGQDLRLAERLGARIGFDVKRRVFHAGSPVIAGTPEELVPLMIDLLPGQDGGALLGRMLAAAAEAPQAEAVPLAPLLGRFRRAGMAIGLATNDGEAPARAHLAAAGIESLFDFVAGYDSGWGAKPGPGMLLAFCASMQIVPAEAIMVGDSRHDLMAGRSAGMRTVAVLTGLAEAGELAPLADVVLPDIGALPEWLQLRGREAHPER